ncbi:MAG: hypothetical protein GPJ54_21880, partial [Candidatus Heimdallarchaeota archaeon]|nr:hypothetical protein [Candidatus Heimdallarchaeota archaeon]
KYAHWLGDDFNTIREFEFQLVNLDADSELEILYSRFFWYFGWPISQLTSLDGDGTIIKTQYLPFGKDLVFNVGDIDGVGTSTEIILAVKYFFNPSIAILAVFDNNFGLKDGVAPVILNGMFPITEIAVGDFDETTTGEEFIYFFEMAELNLPEIIYNLIGFPTLFIQFGWNNAFNSNYTIPLDFDNIIGIAPTGEPTVNYWVEVAKDVDGTAGNDITYLVIESRTGDLFNYDFSASGVLMTHTGIIRDSAIPYAKTSFVTGTFEGCGTNSFITLTAANSISCYYNNDGSLNFTSPIEAWSRTLEFDVIQDMIVADLDDDGIDDLLIASFSGYVWVTRSNPPPQPLLQLSADSLLTENIPSSVENDTPTPLIILGFGTSFMTGLLVILKKKKILPL